jgi:hypothetical protein
VEGQDDRGERMMYLSLCLIGLLAAPRAPDERIARRAIARLHTVGLKFGKHSKINPKGI